MEGERRRYLREIKVERSSVEEIEKSELGEWMREMKKGFERMAERTERAVEEERREFREQGRGLNDE